MKETRFYKKKLTATTTQQSLNFEDLGVRLAKYSILNYGDNEVYIEPDNDIDNDSVLLPIGSNIDLGPDNLSLQYKSVSGESTLYLTGIKHVKS